MRTFTYKPEGHPHIRVVVRAWSPHAAAILAGEFIADSKRRMLLIGPIELEDEPVYR